MNQLRASVSCYCRVRRYIKSEACFVQRPQKVSYISEHLIISLLFSYFLVLLQSHFALMMLSPSSRPEFSGSGSGSPSQVQQSITRRKRKALSCYDCRRRKLRCDRELPTCGRCSKAGHADTCSYDERAITPKNITSGTALLKKSSSTTHPSTEWSPALSVAHKRLTDGSENRRSIVEASQTSGTWKLHGEISPTNVEAEQRPAIRADAEDLLRFPRPLTPTETIIFRGENFKTQYYGGSNPTSLIAHVRPSWILCGQLFLLPIIVSIPATYFYYFVLL